MHTRKFHALQSCVFFLLIAAAYGKLTGTPVDLWRVAFWSMLGRHGVGLQGGRFFTIGGAFTSDHPVARWKLSKVRWVGDVAVSGSMTWNRRTGAVRSHVEVSGTGAVPGRLVVRWNDLRRHAPATVTGRLGGERVGFRFPAP